MCNVQTKHASFSGQANNAGKIPSKVNFMNLFS